MLPVGARLRLGKRHIVEQWERGLLFRHGALVENLGPGAYRRWRPGFTIRRVDLRPWVLSAPTQEVPTSEGITVKVTVSGQVTVIDPELFVTATQDAHEALYLAIQVALRELIAGASVEQLVAARGEFGEQLTAAVRGLDALGMTVTNLSLKDIVLPPDLKRAQAAVVIARAEGLAALERARGETAALRNLANAARMAADNPMLIQLRLLQQLEANPGHTVVIGTPPFTEPAKPPTDS
jgi:regulator of protease activity HflC (stomatin/prohibitin superfamily)